MTLQPKGNLFAARTAWDLRPTSLSTAVTAARAGGREVLDLTCSNPTRCEFTFSGLFDRMSPCPTGDRAQYQPDAQGQRAARMAVVDYYADQGCRVRPEQIFLTASTSEAYSFLFRLLANPGDRIAVPTPSYPLLDYLADLSDIRLVRYPLHYDDRWWLDVAKLRELADAGLRGVVTISPNNPTGSTLSATERAALVAMTKQHGIALMADEVFSDYLLEGTSSTFAAESEVLTFTLSGVSKVLALPHMKLSWIVVSGPDDVVAEACERLQVIADTFLSVAMPVQDVLPAWLAKRHIVHDEIRARLQANRRVLRESFGDDCLQVSGGWSAVIRVPRVVSDEALCLSLLEEQAVQIDPGHLFGFPASGYVVVSLLTPEAGFAQGIGALAEHVAALLS